MATIFSTDGKIKRGCYSKITLDTSGGQGASLRPGDLSNSCVIIGFSTKKEESVSIVKCFNDNSFIYAFGDNIEQSYLAVKAICFIGGDVSTNNAFADLTSFYNTYRLSQYAASPLQFYYGGNNTIPCYLLGMDTSTADVKYLLQEVTFRLIMLQSTGADAAKSSGFSKTGTVPKIKTPDFNKPKAPAK